jgi:hypothetical protein
MAEITQWGEFRLLSGRAFDQRVAEVFGLVALARVPFEPAAQPFTDSAEYVVVDGELGRPT